jgi:hypothetical protein
MNDVFVFVFVYASLDHTIQYTETDMLGHVKVTTYRVTACLACGCNAPLPSSSLGDVGVDGVSCVDALYLHCCLFLFCYSMSVSVMQIWYSLIVLCWCI